MRHGLLLLGALPLLWGATACSVEPGAVEEPPHLSQRRAAVTSVGSESLSQTFLNDVARVFPESRSPVSGDAAFIDNADPNMLVQRDNTEVFVTFISSRASLNNTLVYFTYPDGQPPASAPALSQSQVVFASGSRSATGARVSLGTFNAGTRIGLALVANGGAVSPPDLSRTKYYSLPALNPDGAHFVSKYHKAEQRRIIGAEDLPIASSDKDYNDMLVVVTTNPRELLGCTGSSLPDLCSATGNSAGKVEVNCYCRNADSSFSNTVSFNQVITGTNSWTGQWAYGEGLRFVDFNGDGRTDLCSTTGTISGQVEVYCYYRNADGSFSNTPSFSQIVTGTSGWLDRWRYGEALRLIDINADGRVDLCSTAGAGAGQVGVACYYRNVDGSLSNTYSFYQQITGTSGWTGAWAYGEALRLVDVNADGRVDLCSTAGTSSGQAAVACYYRSVDGSFSNTLSFYQVITGTSSWAGQWVYGEGLRLVDINADGRVDLCSTTGTGSGQAAVACYYRHVDGSFSNTLSLYQVITGTSGWSGEWVYGQSLHLPRMKL